MIERPFFPGLARRLKEPGALILTGMRRVGKTTALRYLLERAQGDNKIFIDLENPARRKIFEEEDYERVKDAFTLLGLDFSKRAFVFLDEIQFAPRLPSAVKYLMDHYGVKFVLTGSASFYMKNLFTESLSGRKRLVQMYPLDFPEFLLFKGERLKPPPAGARWNPALFSLYDRLYAEYLEFGGFPQVVLAKSARQKRENLEDIFSSFFQKEVAGLGDFRKNNAVRDFMLLLLSRTGAKLDISKISSEIGISRPTLMEYAAFLEATYFIHIVPPYSRGRDVEIRGQPKIYACDMGMAGHFGRASTGALFENAVFLDLKRRGEVRYYQRKSGVELDFILNGKQAYEAKLSAHSADVNKARRLARELGIKKCRVLSRQWPAAPGAIPPI